MKTISKDLGIKQRKSLISVLERIDDHDRNEERKEFIKEGIFYGVIVAGLYALTHYAVAVV